MKLNDTIHNWKEAHIQQDGSYSPSSSGIYMHKCPTCDVTYFGYKGRGVCYACYKQKMSDIIKTAAQQRKENI